MLTEREVNVIRGKALVSMANDEEIIQIFQVMDEMEALLDEADEEDALGTEGWRHRIGWDG